MVYVGGSFTNIGGAARNRIAQLDTTGGLASTWNPNANNAVMSLARIGSTIFAGGLFTNIGAKSIAYLAQIDGAGTVPNWNPFLNAPVRTLGVNGSTLYLGGDFTNLNSGAAQRFFIASLDPATALALPWDPVCQSTVKTLLISGYTVYADGSFYNVSRQPQSHLVAIEDPAPVGVGDAPSSGAGGLALRNAPNPFSVETVIRFRLPQEEAVTLRVFDLQGREVRRLLDRARLPAGEHEAPFRASGLKSGVYLYRIEAGTQKAVSKLVLTP